MLLVGEVGEEHVGQGVDRGLEALEVAAGDVGDQSAVDLLDRVMDRDVLLAELGEDPLTPAAGARPAPPSDSSLGVMLP